MTMHARSRAAALAASLMLLPAAQAEPADLSALAGRWAVDVSRLPMPAAVRPQRVTLSFTPAPGDRLATRVEVVDASGTVLFAESLAALDGVPVPVQGNLEADTAAVSLPAPGVLVMQLSRAGVPGSTRIYTVAPDRKSLLETAANFGEDGRPVMRRNVFVRVE